MQVLTVHLCEVSDWASLDEGGKAREGLEVGGQ